MKSYSHENIRFSYKKIYKINFQKLKIKKHDL